MSAFKTSSILCISHAVVTTGGFAVALGLNLKITGAMIAIWGSAAALWPAWFFIVIPAAHRAQKRATKPLALGFLIWIVPVVTMIGMGAWAVFRAKVA